MHGVVTTYQQVALSPTVLRGLAQHAFVILDEVHHGGEERAWGDALQEAFGGAARRLCLSGTPFRSDTRAIPFVRYEADEAVPDFEYGYGDALRDGGVVRPIYFPAVGGEMEWSAPNGALHAASFNDPLSTVLANQRLRTALSLEGDWLPAVLRDAVTRLAAVRRVQPDAGGLVIATDQEHARDIADLLSSRFQVAATVVTSDDPRHRSASRRSPRAPATGWWRCGMVSEGVDIPRLRVGVYATPTTTDLFFRQAVGRFVRWVAGVRDQRAWLFVPDDLRLRAWASLIAEQRRHSLVRDASRTPAFEAPRLTAELDAAEQLSLFAPLSAVATGTAMSPWHEPLPDDWSAPESRAWHRVGAGPAALRSPPSPVQTTVERVARQKTPSAWTTPRRPRPGPSPARRTPPSTPSSTVSPAYAASPKRPSRSSRRACEHAERWLARARR